MATSRFVSLLPSLSRRPNALAIGALAAIASIARAQQLEVQFPGSQANGVLGSAAGSGFDCDGDGVPDVVVGAPLDGASLEGFVYLYSGANFSLIDSFSLGPSGSISGFGDNAALIGDVDGDGLSEIAVGAAGYFTGTSSPPGFYGIYSLTQGLIRSGSGSNLGSAVAAAGDVDLDGAMDFIVGAAGADFVTLRSGRTNASLHQFNGTQTGAGFGTSVAGNVDVDGDGTPDVIIGEPRFTFTFHGTTVSNCGHVTVYSGATFNPIWDALGPHAQDQLGNAVCGIGDVNGDGRSEVLAGSSAAGGGKGIVIKFDGKGSPLLTITPAGTDGYGQSLCAVPDLDGDGIPDYAIGAPLSSAGGYVDLRKGDDDAQLWLFTPPDNSISDYGWSVAADDFDGDGRGDFVIGAPLRPVNGLNNAGGADVWRTVEAAATNYGAGFPGTLGIPNLTAVNLPGISETFTANLDNSLGAPTFALLVLGFSRANVVTSAGGTLLVAPFDLLPLSLPAAGLPLSGNIPADPSLIGFLVDLQVLESDAGAAHHISFTPGLELTIGVDYP